MQQPNTELAKLKAERARMREALEQLWHETNTNPASIARMQEIILEALK